MFDPQQCFTDLTIHGGYYFSAVDMAQKVDMSHVKWLEDTKNSTPFFWADRDEKLEEYMSMYTQLLRQVFSSLDVEKMWYCNGVEDTSCPWHSDLLEEIDVSILCYLSDMSPEVGGYVAIRNLTTGNSVMYYPKFGDCLVLWHTKGFEHRAQPAIIDRLYVNCTYKNARL